MKNSDFKAGMQRILKYLIVFLAYLIIIISLFLPLSENIHSRILGTSPDVGLSGEIWYQWFVKKCILKLDLGSLYHTDFIAYPSGKNLFFNLGFPLLPIFSIPFQIILTFPDYYNIFMITIMVINGVACFALLRYIYKDILTAFIGGLFFSLNPYVFYQVNTGRVEQAAIFWLPFFILILLKIKDENKKAYPIIGALVLVLTSLSYWYYGVFLFIFTVLLLLCGPLLKKDNFVGYTKKIILLLCLYGMFMFIVFFHPLLISNIRPSGYKLIFPFPSQGEILLHKTSEYFAFIITFTSINWLPHSFLAIIASIIALSILNFKAMRSNLFYIITAVFFFVISLGPYVEIFKHTVALPYILLYYLIPFFPRLWWPINCFSITVACATILLASLIHQLRLKSGFSTKNVLPVLLTICYLFPFYSAQYNIFGSSPKAPPKYKLVDSVPLLDLQKFTFSKLKKIHEVHYYLKEQQDCAIIELPFDLAYSNFLFNQTIHEKKIFDCPGYHFKESVWPKKHLKYLRSNEFLRYLDLLFSNAESENSFPNAEADSEQALKSGLKQLYEAGFRFIVVNPYYFRSRVWLLNELKTVLKEPFMAYADGVLLYRIEDLIGGD